jgi:hypothetical protein
MFPTFLHDIDKLGRALLGDVLNVGSFSVHDDVLEDGHGVVKVGVRGGAAEDFPEQDAVGVEVNLEGVLLAL